MSQLERICNQIDDETLQRDGAPGTHPQLDRLVRTIWRLRQPDGCPWDKVQTHESISRNMIEEAYEALDAIEEGNPCHLQEELGDVLMQVLLHAQIASDEGTFDFDDLCRGLNEKLVRRHPHVFEDQEADSAEAALASWDQIKRQEREEKGRDGAEPGLLDSIPSSLPALMECQKVSKRAADQGFEWPDVDAVWEKVAEEKAEFLAEPRGSDEAKMEFGDLLFALVNVARHEGIDAEAALRASTAKFRERWARVEAIADTHETKLEPGMDPSELDAIWDEAKRS